MRIAIAKRVGVLTVAAVLAVVGLGGSTAAAAPPPFLTQFPADAAWGTGANQLWGPSGIAADPLSGDLYVTDGSNKRISVFTAAGEFVKAFGWDVAPDGAPGDTAEDEFEICTETCQEGAAGDGAGQFRAPTGLAVDNAGSVYVRGAGVEGHRIQKFSSAGEFLFMLGGEVNKTTGANICTKADLEGGDVCGGAVEGPDPGEFNRSGFAMADSIDVDASGALFVGDDVEVQKFSPGGTYLSQIPTPVGPSEVRTVEALAVDRTDGDLYLSLVRVGIEPRTSIFYELDSATGAVLTEFNVGNPNGAKGVPFPITGQVLALAVGSTGEIYAAVNQTQTSTGDWWEILGFEPGGACLPGMCAADWFGKVSNDPTPRITGLATSVACELSSDDLIATYAGNNQKLGVQGFARIYGPAPDCGSGAAPPRITDQYAYSVGADSATVRAQINPRLQADTTYYVEYGTSECSSGGCERTRPAPPGAVLSTETAGVPIRSRGVLLADLQPDTTYHYRFVATNGGGQVKGVGGKVGVDGSEGTFTTATLPFAPKTSCPNQQFRTGPSAFLPDCRAFELVSPADKEGGEVAVRETIVTGPASLSQSTAAGDKISYSAYRAYGQVESAPWSSQYIAERTTGGWVGRSISPPREGLSLPGQQYGLDTPFKVFSPDLCQGWFLQDTAPVLDPAAPSGFAGLYRRDICGSTPGYSAITRGEPENNNQQGFMPELQGVSADGSCAVFRVRGKLTADASDAKSGPTGVYQVYVTCGEEMRLVSKLPDGSPADRHSSAGTAAGERPYHRDHPVLGALSADGSRVYWTAADGFGRSPGTLYVRDNADREPGAIEGGVCTETELACTYPVSETVGPGNATFHTANRDGSVALFSIGESLYRYDFDTSSSEKVAGGFKGMLGASKDLSRVYLASTEALGDSATAGKFNLYLSEGGEFTWIGELSQADVTAFRGPVSVIPRKRTARVSADGSHAAFMAWAPLTGYDNTDAASGARDAQVFVYDAEADGGVGSLACVSCNPTGGRPLGQQMEYDNPTSSYLWVAAQLPTAESQLYSRRVLSEDGSRLFFESFESLVLRDTNGKQDVYEWHSAGSEAACRDRGAEIYVASAKGCISLISSGKGDQDASFAEASASGDDVFFITGASLVEQDSGLFDLYDAKVGGGFAPPAAPPAPCEGEACQSPSSPPVDPTPASASFRGPGNESAKKPQPRCRKATGKSNARKGKGKSKSSAKAKARCAKPKPKKQKQKKAKNNRRAAR